MHINRITVISMHVRALVVLISGCSVSTPPPSRFTLSAFLSLVLSLSFSPPPSFCKGPRGPASLKSALYEPNGGPAVWPCGVADRTRYCATLALLCSSPLVEQSISAPLRHRPPVCIHQLHILKENYSKRP